MVRTMPYSQYARQSADAFHKTRSRVEQLILDLRAKGFTVEVRGDEIIVTGKGNDDAP